ncbi:TraE/TraK family type IV conjugative transfer system protein [Vibrio maritimus]
MNLFKRKEKNEAETQSPGQGTWTAAINQAKKLTTMLMISVLANLVLVFSLVSKQPIMTVTPPNFAEAFTLVGAKADEAWKRMWAVAIAELLGNANERSLDTVLDAFKPMLRGDDYEVMASQLEAHVKALSIRNQYQEFDVVDSYFDEKYDRVIIYGQRSIKSKRVSDDERLNSRPIRWTYEISIQNAFGTPKLMHISQYEGAPKIDRARFSRETTK